MADAKSVWSWRKLLKEVQSFYLASRACVMAIMDMREWFLVNVELRQCCVMSPWLFNVHVYGWCGTIGQCKGA